MSFDVVKAAHAQDCVLAHVVVTSRGRLPKGHILSPDDIGILRDDGISDVTVYRLAPDDLLEDVAAARIAAAVPADHLRLSEAATGRVNFYATANGLFLADKAVVDRFNGLDPALTIACLADHAPVRAGDMVATIKIIPLAARAASVEAAETLFADCRPFEVLPFRAHGVTLVATELPSLKPSVMDKTAQVLRQRLAASASVLTSEIRCRHDAAAVAEALGQALSAQAADRALIVIFGASAVADANDVIPAAIRLAGGTVEQVGMPVDPGNLLVLGRIGAVTVIGAPGCARSPKENGFDWVLSRVIAGEAVTRFDLAGMGVGGLLMEIPTRPRLRESGHGGEALAIGGLLLAAGQARRMGDGPHKLLARFDDRPLVRRSAEILLASGVADVIAVTGHRREEIEAALSGLPLECRYNPDFAAGMGTSLAQGFAQDKVSAKDGILVMLADMPGVTTAHLDRLIAAFREANGNAIIRAVSNGKRGNPVLLPRAVFEDVQALQGDVGARAIIESAGLPVIDVEIGEAAHLDVDTPDAVVAAGGILRV